MKGGLRQGAGRPKGVKNREISLRKRIFDFFTEEEIVNLVEQAKKQAEIKPEILKFLVEQIFGRAFQRVEMKGEDRNPVVIQIWKEIADKNSLNATNETAIRNN